MLTDEAQKLFPELIVEHSRTMGPVNGYNNWDASEGTGRLADEPKNRVAFTDELLKFSEVYRTYDTLGKIAPYVMATLHTSGDLAVAFGKRTTANPENKSFLPAADVFFDIDGLNRNVCLFNVNGNVSMRVDKNVEKIKVLAQDLLADKAIDVSDKVVF